MEVEGVSSGTFLDKDACPWDTTPFQTDGVWADVALQQPVLQKVAGSIDSESSCTFTDPGDGPGEVSEWDPFCAEWNGSKTAQAEVDTPIRQDTLATPPFELIVDVEQQGLWYALL